MPLMLCPMGVTCTPMQTLFQTEASAGTTFAAPAPAHSPNSVARARGSYPYLFVFPLYRFLKIRDLPDKPRLLLLQLPDFLRRGTDRKKADTALSREKKSVLDEQGGEVSTSTDSAARWDFFSLALLLVPGRKPAWLMAYLKAIPYSSD